MSDNKLAEEREQRRNAFLAWDIENELPLDIGEYHLERIDKQEERIYRAFGWTSSKNGWQVRAIFDEETMDYMIKMDLNLVVLTEIEVITGDFETFKDFVKRWTVKAIKKELLQRKDLSVLVKGHAFTQWDYSHALPEKIGHFTRVIEPVNPLQGLNGSYIIATYECREKELGALFFYNVYRDEYYGEFRAGGIPIIIHTYDAKDVKKFDMILTKYLEKDLQNLYDHPVMEDE